MDFCFIITDDLNVSGIIAAVVFVALVMALCGLGVFYAQKKGYFTSKYSKITPPLFQKNRAVILHVLLFMKTVAPWS